MLRNLKLAIEERHGSQLAFSRSAGIHPVTLSKIVNGWREASAIERERIIAALPDVDPRWLFEKRVHIPAPRGSEAEPAPVAMSCAAEGDGRCN